MKRQYPHSRNDYTYRLLEQIDPKDFIVIALRLKTRHRAVEQLRRITLKRFKDGSALEFCTEATVAVHLRAVEILGDNSANPSKEQVNTLAVRLIEEFGHLLTKMYFAQKIDHHVSATPLLIEQLESEPLLSILPHVHEQHNGALAPIQNSVTPEIKQSRKERRQLVRLQRNGRKNQEHQSRQDEHRWSLVKKLHRPPLRKKIKQVQTADVPAKTFSDNELLPLDKLEIAATDHQMCREVYWAWISFNKRIDSKIGKVRPCVVIAVANSYILVRPIFTKPRLFSRGWNSVRLIEWQQLGLDHESHVSDDTQKIRHQHLNNKIGKLSPRDWNLIHHVTGK